MPDAPLLEVTVRIEIRWRDLDLLGHLNQAVYHEYLEEGRAALLERIGGASEVLVVLARVEIDFRREVRRDHGHVDVVVRLVDVGRSSLLLEHDVVLPDGTVAAEGRSVLVAWDPARRGARPLSPAERSRLGVD